MSRRSLNNPATDAIIMALSPYVFGGAIFYYLYKRSQTTIPAKIEEIKAAASQIKATLPGVIKDKLTGVSEKTYITPEQAKLNDAAALAAKRAGLSPFLYGIR